MQIKAIIFDVDGVLLNSNPAYAYVFQEILKNHGLKISKKEIYPMFGEPAKIIIKHFLGTRYNKHVFDEYKNLISKRNFIQKLKPIKNVKNVLRLLKNKKYRLAIVSGSMRIALIPALKHHGLDKFFNAIISADDIKTYKPHPGPLLVALKKLHARKNETLYIGDAPTDVIMARRAKVKCVVVLTGILKRKEALKLKPDYIVKNLSEIERILGN